MENFSSGSLVINVTNASGVLRLDWRGKSNDRQPGRVLAPFFQTVVAEAASKHATLEMHFEALEYFNSSTITSIIQVIQDMRQKRLAMVIVFAENIKWQKLGFDALRIFDKGDRLLSFKAA